MHSEHKTQYAYHRGAFFTSYLEVEEDRRWLNSPVDKADLGYAVKCGNRSAPLLLDESHTSAASSKRGELSHEAGFVKTSALVHLCAFSTFTMTRANSDTMHATVKSI
uniref:Uncharacterized protein n=1 Tax=Rhipicephalus zambeziensis TaxID=60191 RepID=A0A224YF32_9ACAR